MKQDSMVIEYRGERLRRTVADARERRYRAAGKDCYLFNVNDDTVIDATMKGTKGRFTVCLSLLMAGTSITAWACLCWLIKTGHLLWLI